MILKAFARNKALDPDVNFVAIVKSDICENLSGANLSSLVRVAIGRGDICENLSGTNLSSLVRVFKTF